MPPPNLNHTMQELDYKQEAMKQWGIDPAGSTDTNKIRGTKEFFDEVEKIRYGSLEQEWTKHLINDLQPQGKSVLEIGVGLGTDHMQFARLGAILTGIDITPECIALTKKRFTLEGYTSDLRVTDAEHLPFADNTFDMVYSFGVIHHIPNMNRIVEEIRRVLKPGGTAIVSIYNKYSFFIFLILIEWFRSREFLKESWRNRLRRIEASSDPSSSSPIVQLSTSRQARRLFKRFSKVDISKDHLGVIGRRINIIRQYSLKSRFLRKFLDFLAHHVGWYIIIRATK